MRVFIAGAGLMGSGIALDVGRKHDVIIYDISDKALRNAEKMASEHRLEVSVTKNIGEAAKCDIAIEAVFESLNLKVEVLSKLEKITKAYLCSNTSVISVDDIADRLESRERFCGLHWMNPPHVMPLVEIILSKYTEKNTVEFLEDFLRDLGKEPIICKGQSLVNRFNAAVLAEAAKMIEEGVKAEDVDKVWKCHLGILYTLFGPMGNIDHIGLDVVYYASLYLYERFGDEKFRPPQWLIEKVEKGELGVKSGKGVYEYPESERAFNERVVRVKNLLSFLGLR